MATAAQLAVRKKFAAAARAAGGKIRKGLSLSISARSSGGSRRPSGSSKSTGMESSSRSAGLDGLGAIERKIVFGINAAEPIIGAVFKAAPGGNLAAMDPATLGNELLWRAGFPGSNIRAGQVGKFDWTKLQPTVVSEVSNGILEAINRNPRIGQASRISHGSVTAILDEASPGLIAWGSGAQDIQTFNERYSEAAQGYRPFAHQSILEDPSIWVPFGGRLVIKGLAIGFRKFASRIGLSRGFSKLTGGVFSV